MFGFHNGYNRTTTYILRRFKMSYFIKNLIANVAILNSKDYKELKRYQSVNGHAITACAVYFTVVKAMLFKNYGHESLITFARTVKHIIK